MKSTRAAALPRSRRAFLSMLGMSAALVGVACSVPGTAPGLVARPRFSPQYLIKSDIDHFVEASQWRIFVSLRRLAEKLYRRNPREWVKGGTGSEDAALARIFERNHGWRFDGLGHQRDIEALTVAFRPDYAGDRVEAFIVGLASMVQTAFGDNVAFYLLSDLDPQGFYNAAQNVEIAAWKLATARDLHGGALLLSNEMGVVTNLSFEREFGRIIGLLEVLTDMIEAKTERTVVRVVQNMATAVFLPMP